MALGMTLQVYFQKAQRAFLLVFKTIIRPILQIARKYLFYETRKKAVAIFCSIFLLSIVASFITFPEDVYIVQVSKCFNFLY